MLNVGILVAIESVHSVLNSGIFYIQIVLTVLKHVTIKAIELQILRSVLNSGICKPFNYK